MSGTPQRLTRAEQQQRTRERLLAAAADVFAEHGFDGSSIDEITARAGFSRGAFYSNFTDKIDLLITLCDRRLAEFARDELPLILATPEEDRLAVVARWLAEDLPQEVLLVVELARHRNDRPDTAAALQELLDRVLAGIEGILAAEGSELASLSVEERRVRAHAALGAILGMELLGYLGAPADAKVIELMLAGVAATDPGDLGNGR